MTGQRVTQDIPYALVPRWVIRALGLDLTALATYTAIAAYASDSRQAFPGIRRLAQDLNCSPTTVQAALRRLEQTGAVQITRTRNGGRRGVNLYHLPCDPMVGILAAASRLPVDKPVDK
jgi:DNA-binding MarR family transcriptional regulator